MTHNYSNLTLTENSELQQVLLEHQKQARDSAGYIKVCKQIPHLNQEACKQILRKYTLADKLKVIENKNEE